jgi:hypothetical protein
MFNGRGTNVMQKWWILVELVFCLLSINKREESKKQVLYKEVFIRRITMDLKI